MSLCAVTTSPRAPSHIHNIYFFSLSPPLLSLYYIYIRDSYFFSSSNCHFLWKLYLQQGQEQLIVADFFSSIMPPKKAFARCMHDLCSCSAAVVGHLFREFLCGARTHVSRYTVHVCRYFWSLFFLKTEFSILHSYSWNWRRLERNHCLYCITHQTHHPQSCTAMRVNRGWLRKTVLTGVGH